MSRKRNEAKAVRVLEKVGVSTSDYLSILRDPETGKYAAPVPENPDMVVREFHDTAKFIEKELYMENSDAREEDFELTWPSIWKAMQQESSVEERPVKYFAILDTGFMSDHPLLNGLVEASVDFTAEGIEDQHGHGTTVALIASGECYSPIPATFTTRLLNVKVISGDGKGSSNNLVKGLRWVASFKEEYGLDYGDIVANLSVGTYSRRWGIFDCRGNCRVCRTAVEVAEQDILVFAAAGNKAGASACPAKAGVAGKHGGIIAVGASDYAGSGIGTVMRTGGHVVFRRIE